MNRGKSQSGVKKRPSNRTVRRLCKEKPRKESMIPKRKMPLLTKRRHKIPLLEMIQREFPRTRPEPFATRQQATIGEPSRLIDGVT